MRAITLRPAVFATVFLLCGLSFCTEASAQVTPNCPTFSGTNSTGCGAVIDIKITGTTVTPGPATGPYDGSDDTLIGVANNIPACKAGQVAGSGCGINIFSIDLTSNNGVCAFDGDGIDLFGAPGNPKDSTAYGGPNTYFTPIPPATIIDQNKCRVNFITPLKPGDTTYFSLENALSTATTPCTAILNGSLKGAATTGSFSPPPAPTGSGPNTAQTVGMRATFVPQGNDPSTGKPWTLAAAAAACGFVDWNWKQYITNWPTPSNLTSNCAPLDASRNPIPNVAPPAFIDPPSCGYTYMGTYNNPFGTYSNPNISTGFFALAPHQSAVTSLPQYLGFEDAPNDPLLPAGQTMNFSTSLVGMQGPNLASSVAVDTGIGFTWKSDHKGSAGGTTVTGSPVATADTSGTGGPTVVSVSQTSTYTGVGVTGINGGSPNVLGVTSLLSAVLPASRSVQVSATATAFATVINTGANTAASCSIAQGSGLTGTFAYQTTNPATNAVTGTVNTPVDIPAGASQSFVIALTPTAAIAPADMAFNFACTNTAPAAIVTGLNTLLFSASTTPVPDIVALGATLKNDGIVHVAGSPSTGVFAVATFNLGASGSITASADTGDAALPITITICQTDPKSGQCLQTPSANVTTTINANATPTFGIFVAASAAVPFDPAGSRIFVKFSDSGNAVRGETSVAVTTQ